MRIPVATYRLQFHKEFGFAQARELLSYFDDLGVSTVYASPVFHARPGSVHGYDVVDANRINPELGGETQFDALTDEARRLGLSWLQDIVPNHMAYDSGNWMLMDVLENGPNSPYADFFDIEWDHPMENMRGKVLAPFLGEFYGQCLENGEIVLQYDAQGLAVHYYQLRLPVSIESYTQVLSHGLGALRRRLGQNDADLIKLLGVLYTLKNLPSTEEARERADQITFVKSMLWELYTTNGEIKAYLDDNVARFNGRRGDPESFNALDQLLSQQYYRLSLWKVATEEINYRRFFNINELISLRAEDRKVFEATHALVFKLIEQNKITGIRIDHIDGLYDPATYLKRIREKTGELFVVVEKILDLREELPRDWPICGTTGYEFANYLNGLFCQSAHEQQMTELYQRFTGNSKPFADLVSEKKRLIIGRHMAGDVDRLANLLKRTSSHDRYGGDITLYGLKRALVEVLTFFPVYRSYINADTFSADDRKRLQETLLRAKEVNPGLLFELSFIEKFLLLEYGDRLSEEEKKQWIHFIMCLQQLTGPLMAKGFEDTTLYIYNRLLSLNEVGGDPGRFGIAPEAFHDFNQRRAQVWPHTLNATSTHDTKRGEDVRARINVLSELPEEWQAQVTEWARLNRDYKRTVKGQPFPDSNDEYFLYQSLLGACPLDQQQLPEFAERVKSYMIKAVREAKVHTGWVKPDADYEDAFTSFIDHILQPSSPFLQMFLPFARRIARRGAINSLAQALFKITSPGVPDFYQGSELWELHFVDPDNRRPVNFAQRQSFLDDIKRRDSEDGAALHRELLESWQDGRVKLYLTYKALNFRRANRELFEDGAYLPVFAGGRFRDNVCAYIRRFGASCALVAAPLLTTHLTGDDSSLKEPESWGDTTLSLPDDTPDSWRNVLTGQTVHAVRAGAGKKTIELNLVFDQFPVALLVGYASVEESRDSVFHAGALG